MQCQAFTKSNQQCSRLSAKNNNCWQHQISDDSKESQLIPELEILMSEYLDPETYGKLMLQNPKQYTLKRYEPIIAEAEDKAYQDELKIIEDKLDKLLLLRAKKAPNRNTIRDIITLTNRKNEILETRILETLNIM